MMNDDIYITIGGAESNKQKKWKSSDFHEIWGYFRVGVCEFLKKILAKKFDGKGTFFGKKRFKNVVFGLYSHIKSL